jgi:hypothetical protein
LQGKPLECGREACGEAPPDRDPVPGRLHVPPELSRLLPILGPSRVSGDHPCERSHPGEERPPAADRVGAGGIRPGARRRLRG